MTDVFKIGLTLPGTALTALTVKVPRPRATFIPAVSSKTAASGLVIDSGFPVITWSWGFLTRTQRDQLRQFCSTASSLVYIRTTINDSADSWATYLAYMVWPKPEPREATRRINFVVNFTSCIYQYASEPA